jgi:hypothetical protein
MRLGLSVPRCHRDEPRPEGGPLGPAPPSSRLLALFYGSTPVGRVLPETDADSVHLLSDGSLTSSPL